MIIIIKKKNIKIYCRSSRLKELVGTLHSAKKTSSSRFLPKVYP